MSSKQRRERPYSTPGMPSTSSGFTHKPQIVFINKAEQFYFSSNNFLMFIYGLPTVVNHNKRTRELGLVEIHRAWWLHKTSNKCTSFQRIVLLLQLHQKITISKTALYISENCNQQTTIQKKKKNPTGKRKGKQEKMGGKV